MATVNKDFVVKNGVVAGANVQGVQLVSTTSSLPPLTVTSSANVVNLSTDLLDGQHGSYYLDFNNATNIPDPTIAIYLGGSLSGSGVATLTNLGSASIILSDASVGLDSVTLGIETYGDYVEKLVAGTGVSISHTSGESASPTLSIGQDVATSANVSFNTITSTAITGAPFIVSSSAFVSNLNVNYLGGYTAAEIMAMSGVQSVIGTANEIEVSASTGAIQVGLPDNVNIAGSLTVGENLIVSGSTVVVNSTVVTIDDPVFTLGGDTTGVDDGKDRGIEFKWNDGANAKVGFFGYDESSGKFTFIPDATNSSEIFSGTKGTIDANIEWTDVLNKPDPSITLTGDVSGTTTLTDLASASLSVTIEKDFNIVLSGDVSGNATVSNLTSASINVNVEKDFNLVFNGDVTGTGTVSNLNSASITLSLPQSVDPSATPSFVGVDLPNGKISSNTVTILVNNTDTTIDSFSTSSFTTAEYIIQAKQGSKMTSTKVIVMWDGTNVYVSEYAIVDSSAGAANITLSATENSGTVYFTASSPDAASTNVIIKVVRTAIDA